MDNQKNQITPQLTLCNGWNGVQEYLLNTLNTALTLSPLAVRNILILVPTSTSGHLLELTIEQTC